MPSLRPCPYYFTFSIGSFHLFPTWSIYFILGFEHFVAQGSLVALYVDYVSHSIVWSNLYRFGLGSSTLQFISMFSDIRHQIQYLMRRQSHWDWLSILWSRLMNLWISHTKPLIGPRVNYICNKLGTWIVCTSLRGSVGIGIGLYNPIEIGIG